MCLSSYMRGSRAGLVFFFSLAVARKRQKQGEKRWGSKGLLLAPDAAGSAVFSGLLVFATQPALSVQLVALSARGKSCRGSQGSAAYGVEGALGFCSFSFFFPVSHSVVSVQDWPGCLRAGTLFFLPSPGFPDCREDGAWLSSPAGLSPVGGTSLTSPNKTSGEMIQQGFRWAA